MMKHSWLRGKADRNGGESDFPALGRWQYKLKENEVYCSPEMDQIYGLHTLGKPTRPDPFIASIVPEDRDLVLHCWRMLCSGKRVGRSFSYRIKVGASIKYVEYTARCTYDDNGHMSGLEGTVRDVTTLLDTPVTRLFLRHDRSFLREPQAAIALDHEFGIIHINQWTEQLFGWSENEVLFQHVPYLPKSLESSTHELYQAVVNTGGTIWLDTVRLHKDGSLRRVSVALGPLYDKNGVTKGLMTMYTPISGAADAIERALVCESRLRPFIEHASDVFLLLDEQYKILYANAAVEHVIGMAPSDVHQLSAAGLVHPADRTEFELACQKVAYSRTEQLDIEFRFQHRSGAYRQCVSSLFTWTSPGGQTHVVLRFRDVTEARSVRQQMQFLEQHDELTGLLNRKAFFQKSTSWITELGSEHPLTVMLLRIQQFERIVENLGHTVGDFVIRLAAERIRCRLPEDSICARIGDHEFAIMLRQEERGTELMLALASELLRAFEEPFASAGHTIYVTAAIGVSFYPADGDDIATLVQRAGVALRRANDATRNSVQTYSTQLHTGTYKQFVLANDLRNALANNAFLLYYQPRVDVQSGRIVAAEALIRWEHPTWGLVSPVEFIPIAEETGYIVDLGYWVIRTACQQLRIWRNKGYPPIKISINVAVKQFQAKGAVQTVLSILNECGVPASAIEFEITETSVMPNDPAVTDTIQAFRKAGIAIYFDDFGTGYSSLSWLHQFQLDGLKLDKSFIDHVPNAWAPSQIVKSVIGLAHQLKLTVVAEGVENAEQLAFLQAEQCDQVQGYLYSKPVPAGTFERLLAQSSIRPTAMDTAQRTQTNRRKYVRLSFDEPLPGEVTLASISGKPLSLGYTQVSIVDAGAGGISFLSKLRFPPDRHELRLRFRYTLADVNIEVEGYVVWAKELQNSIFQYGAEFDVDESTKSRLQELLHRHQSHVQALRKRRLEADRKSSFR
ncbi:PAS domain S-box-containing protein/diguanylate cyclase (GGDEF)-like protein [Alicyclobacillus sacchari]|uniref:PAS domain S-box-containing protein/diguanylate cyclase (GGDEF)-like protein n=1 Tax=Alicyclobacillus sacchari TaxID=392010 RepID=A0A4R8LVS1_9BACL|nr:EAL domain-containing protein [Alicyclobacillus sacchari]TDY51252.1 PAS domain S-box-containing protein/diguanylate cyclase (GGDEF)-like protein [Alicyclobacillus sacchari]GMA56535.1 hypothetical protein GCM10025858_10380 [Alicyclobacillus sacchari]